MPTIGTHWHHPRGTYTARCSYCGASWPSHQLRRDAAGLWACPDEGSGADAVELSRANAAFARQIGRARYPMGAPAVTHTNISPPGPDVVTDPSTIFGANYVWWVRSDMLSQDGGRVVAMLDPYVAGGALCSIAAATRPLASFDADLGAQVVRMRQLESGVTQLSQAKAALNGYPELIWGVIRVNSLPPSPSAAAVLLRDQSVSALGIQVSADGQSLQMQGGVNAVALVRERWVFFAASFVGFSAFTGFLECGGVRTTGLAGGTTGTTGKYGSMGSGISWDIAELGGAIVTTDLETQLTALKAYLTAQYAGKVLL